MVEMMININKPVGRVMVMILMRLMVKHNITLVIKKEREIKYLILNKTLRIIIKTINNKMIASIFDNLISIYIFKCNERVTI